MKRSREDGGEEGEEEEEAVVEEEAGASSSAALSASTIAARVALAALPNAQMYERSFMHREAVTHVLCTSSDFVVTGSKDGQVKFWKKQQRGIEFVKHFRAHLSPISCMAASLDGSLLATTAADKAFKVFDVQAFDMISWVKLEFTPTACEWVGGGSSRAKPTLAVCDADSPAIRLFDATSEGGECVGTVSVHSAPVVCVRMNVAHECLISVDARGVIEYWAADGDHGLPKSVSFRYKTDTDLYAIAKARAAPTALAISPDGEFFAISGSDFKVRLFRFVSGKCRRTFDESYDAMHSVQKDGDDAYRLEAFDFGRRMAVEREYRAANASAPPSNVIFDATGRFLIYPSVVGIKVISISTSRLVSTSTQYYFEQGM